MSEVAHPNMSLLEKLDVQNLAKCSKLFADNFFWHYFNPLLPELEGDYEGIKGLKGFFEKLKGRSDGSCRVNVVNGYPAGDELVVTHVCNRMDLDGASIEFDAVVIWRVVNSKITEPWDIPAINTVRTLT